MKRGLLFYYYSIFICSSIFTYMYTYIFIISTPTCLSNFPHINIPLSKLKKIDFPHSTAINYK